MTLIERLEKAGEGSRELDAELWDLIDDRPRFDLDGGGPLFKRCSVDGCAYDSPPNFTTSLDVAMTLARKLLPGWGRHMMEHAHYWRAHVSAPGDKYTKDQTARAATPALALCLAVLRATQETT